jgi:hypothetical protein
MKKRIIIGLLALSLILVVAAAAWATSGTVPINVTYRDIKIVTNGNTVTADPALGEPFIYNGRTYIPIRMAAQALGLTVDWIDWTNMVTISGSTSSTELEALRTENAALRDKITRLEEGGGDLSDLESTLFDDYETALGDVELDDLTLDGDEDDVDVTIEVDLADFESEWDDLSNSEIENFIDDIVSDIQDEYSEDTVVTGEIIDIDSDDTLVEFDKDGTDDLNVDIGGSSGGDLSDLESNLFDDYETALGDVELDDLTLDGDEDDVEVTIDVDLRDFDSEYNDLSDSDIENFIDDIVTDIQNEYTEDTVVTGVITDIDSGDDLVDFDKDGTDDLNVTFRDSDYR